MIALAFAGVFLWVIVVNVIVHAAPTENQAIARGVILSLLTAVAGALIAWWWA